MSLHDQHAMTGARNDPAGHAAVAGARQRVLQYPAFGVSASTARRMVRAVRGIAMVVEIPKRLTVLTTDPDDNIILQTAFVGKADMRVTAKLAHFEEVRSR